MNLAFPASRRPLVCALGLLAAAGLPAAETSSSTTETKAPSTSYTDQGSTYTNYTTSSFGSGFSNNWNNGFNNSGWNSGFSTYSVRTQYRPIYFPPAPPALGEPIPGNTTRVSLAKFSPPNVLASYVYEPFYAPLSPLIFTEDLSRVRREKLDHYRAARTAALDALHAKLDSLQSADAATRQAQLASFATEQGPTLAGLEVTAEDLRAHFVNGGFFQSGSDWNDTRRWRLGDDTRWESTTDEIKVMTAAAFFQEGLSPAQRRLLRELSMELSDSLQSPGAEIALSAPGPFLYFAPEMARIRLPVDLPAAVTEKISAYQAAKAALKNELREELYKQDRAFFDFKRTNALKALAEKQAAGLRTLEQMAEEIRVALAPYPNPAKPPALPLPVDLSRRIGSYLAEKADWQRVMVSRQEALRAEFPEDRIEYIRQGSGMSLQIVGNRRSKADTTARRAAAQSALAPFNAEQGKRYDALVREKELLRTEVLKIATGVAGGAVQRSIDQLMTQFGYAFNQQERWTRYHDYEVAVLEPGLSAAQRRLLFGAAIEKLDLPLNSRF